MNLFHTFLILKKYII